MAYDLNLDSGDTVQLVGTNTWSGPDRYQYTTGAGDYVGTEYTSICSGINEIHVWQPAVSRRYWLLIVRRLQTPASGAYTSIGVAGMWTAAAYAGTRNYTTPWIAQPQWTDEIAQPIAGGGSYATLQRSWYEVTLPFRRWPHTTYLAFERMRTKFGPTAGLWVLDPSSLQENNVIFGRFSAVEVQGAEGPEHVHSFDATVRQIPMRPRDS